MIRYCIAAGLLMSCAGLSPKDEQVVLPEIEIHAEPIHVKHKPEVRSLGCDSATHDDKRQEFLNKLDCVIKHDNPRS